MVARSHCRPIEFDTAVKGKTMLNSFSNSTAPLKSLPRKFNIINSARKKFIKKNSVPIRIIRRKYFLIKFFSLNLFGVLADDRAGKKA